MTHDYAADEHASFSFGDNFPYAPLVRTIELPLDGEASRQMFSNI